MSERPRDIDSDLASLSLREPFVEGSVTEQQRVALDRRWQVVTEAARRAILADDTTMAVAANHVFGDLGEQTPGNFLNNMAEVNPAIVQVRRRAGVVLDDHLELPNIPDDQIPYGINQPYSYPTREETREELKAVEPWAYDFALGQIHQRAGKGGLTRAEAALVTDRYRRARDVKMLGLIAEVAKEKPMFNEQDGLVMAILESGAQVVFTAKALDADPNLSNPVEWKARHQLKDRVYEVKIGEKKYIMKEKKTGRHTDVFVDHETNTVGRESNRSENEFEIAREFSGREPAQDGTLTLHWEKPVGFAATPDGYQFCLFEKIEGAMDYNMAALRSIADAIAARPLAYIEELQRTQRAIDTLVAENEGRFVLNGGGKLTTADFAAAKTDALISKAERLVRKNVLSTGYVDDDHNAFMIKISSPVDQAKPIELSIIGIDYEFFIKDPARSKKLLRQMDEEELGGEYIQRFLSTRKDENGSYVLTMEDAARLTLYTEMGWGLRKDA